MVQYYQVWLAVDAQHDLGQVLQTTDEPIKHPCLLPPGHSEDLTKSLGVVNVTDPTPAFFVDDTSVWALLIERAEQEERSVADVLAAAVHGHTGPVLRG